MRKLKVLYVEDDPALMGLVAEALRADDRIELLLTARTSEDCLSFARQANFDAALLDLALGKDGGSGLELAISLRGINPNCGLVIFSQHASTKLVSRLPEDQRFSFSVLEKRAPIDFENLIATLISTSQGFSSTDLSPISLDEIGSPLSQFTERDHEIMRLLLAGMSTEYVARTLSLAQVTIRQEISRIYATLVPEKEEGTNLRTRALMKYLSEVQSF